MESGEFYLAGRSEGKKSGAERMTTNLVSYGEGNGERGGDSMQSQTERHCGQDTGDGWMERHLN